MSPPGFAAPLPEIAADAVDDRAAIERLGQNVVDIGAVLLAQPGQRRRQIIGNRELGREHGRESKFLERVVSLNGIDGVDADGPNGVGSTVPESAARGKPSVAANASIRSDRSSVLVFLKLR